jgi:putative lipoic acid-binding regulatory protein
MLSHKYREINTFLSGRLRNFAFMSADDPFRKLQEQLEKGSSWPLVYMFKFIIPADNQKIALVENMFSEEAVITQKASEKGNYISITIKEVMLDAPSVIAIYSRASKIQGVIAL